MTNPASPASHIAQAWLPPHHPSRAPMTRCSMIVSAVLLLELALFVTHAQSLPEAQAEYLRVTAESDVIDDNCTRLRMQIAATEDVVARLADGRMDLPAAVEDLDRINHDRSGFFSELERNYPEAATPRHYLARFAIDNAEHRFAGNSTRRSEVAARLAAEYREMTARAPPTDRPRGRPDRGRDRSRTVRPYYGRQTVASALPGPPTRPPIAVDTPSGFRPSCPTAGRSPAIAFTPTHGWDRHVGRGSALSSAIRHRTAAVGIIGLGYVGLPLARAFARTGFRVLGFDIDPQQGREAQRRASRTSSRSPTRPSPRCASSGFEATDRFDRLERAGRDPHLRADAAHRRPRAGPDLRRELGPRDRRRSSAPGNSSSSKAPPTRRTTRDVVLPVLERTGLAAGHGLLPGVQPRARRPGQRRRTPSRNIPKVVGGLDDASGDVAVRAVPRDRAEGRPRLDAGGGGGVQDPGEHVPGDQHRAGERAEGALRPHGHRRVGGDRRGQDQAVRVPGVLPRPRARRALHPDRPVLPDLDRPQVRA